MFLSTLWGFLLCLQLIYTATTVPRVAGLQANTFAQTDDTISTIYERRVDIIINALSPDDPDPDFSAEDISQWVSSLGTAGKWPDSQIDYTAGCGAQRAVWPAEDHWKRILVMSAAWQGGLPGAQNWTQNGFLRSNISLAMNWWFENDFTNGACVDSGGTPACPCKTPGLWNPNWFSSIILIPDLVGQTCVLLKDTLSQSELGNCIRFTNRAFGTFFHNTNGLGKPTGANSLDVARISVDLGLLINNVTVVSTAYRKAHAEYAIASALGADGIKADGSFGQHNGLVYNGNYGKDFLRDVLVLELASAGTKFEADDNGKAAVGTLLDGDKWMIFLNTVTDTLHWDFSVVGRMISYAVIDGQATSSILIDVPSAADLGDMWNSENISDFASSLSQDSSSANIGTVTGNRMFYDSDYMVHRGENYVSTLRMYSNRTANTECINSLNPFGFHLADGARYTYITGNEYEDIFAAWDWNLIPGITTDYNATTLTCGNARAQGQESFVGGVSNGTIGIGIMKYKNPLTKTFQFQKVWFFMNGVEHVMVSSIQSTSGAPVYSVLDQKRQDGPVLVDGSQVDDGNGSAQRVTGAKSLWHGNIGYIFSIRPNQQSSVDLNVKLESKTGVWQSIGPSISPPTEVDLFSAWLHHTTINESISYTVYPGIDLDAFQSNSANLTAVQEVQNDENISAIYDSTSHTLMAVYWNTQGGSTSFTPPSQSQPITISTNTSLALMYNISSGAVTVSDPSQNLATVSVSVKVGDDTMTLSFSLTSNGTNAPGSSATKGLSAEGKTYHHSTPSSTAAATVRTKKLAYLALLILFPVLCLIALYLYRGRILSYFRVRRQMALRERRNIPYTSLEDVNATPEEWNAK